MHRAIFGSILLLITSCSTFNVPQLEALRNEASILRVRSAAYASLDCNGCASCLVMKAAYVQAGEAAQSLPYEDVEEEEYIAYSRAIRAAEKRSNDATCDCSEDAEVCVPAQEILDLAVQQLDELERSMAIKNPGLSFLGGIGDGVVEGLGGEGGK